MIILQPKEMKICDFFLKIIRLNNFYIVDYNYHCTRNIIALVIL